MNNNISIKQIATELGVAKSTVLRFSRNLNIDLTKHISIEIINKLSNKEFFIESINAGKSLKVVAKELNIPASTIRRYGLKLNIKFPLHPKKIS